MTQEKQQSQESQRQTVGHWLSRTFEWRIPVYQRHYAWDAGDDSGPIHLFWKTVKEQTAKRLKGVKPDQHYLGAVLVDNKTDSQAMDEFKQFDVVDGQQRLTTIQIALCALAKVARDSHDCGDEIWEEVKEYVFYKGDISRLCPTNFDKERFERVRDEASGKLHDEENAEDSKIAKACRFFEDEINNVVKDKDLAPQDPRKVLIAVLDSLLKGFDLVLIVLRPADDAQQIFESLNSYAQHLTIFDLIRNNVFHYASNYCNPKMDVDLYRDKNWQRLEESYWEEKADTKRKGWATHIEAYVARALVAEMRKEFRFTRNEIFQTYRDFSQKYRPAALLDEVKALGRYTKVYRYLDANSEEQDLLSGVDCGIFRYTEWKNRDFYPVIFSIAGSNAKAKDKNRMIQLLESYVIRRAVCKLSTSKYNLLAVAICKEFAGEASYKKLSKLLKGSQDKTYIFPDDDKVIRDCVNAVFYKSTFQHYVLKELEHHLAGSNEKKVAPKDMTIDHILPKSWDTDSGWKEMLAEAKVDPLAVPAYINTIGNLTLMSRERNVKKANNPWQEFQQLLADSDMVLNRKLAKAKHDSWGIEQIAARSEYLAQKICERWPY